MRIPAGKLTPRCLRIGSTRISAVFVSEYRRQTAAARLECERIP
jgi:hypothetical protein